MTDQATPSCPACDCPDSTPWGHDGAVTIRECGRCGTLYFDLTGHAINSYSNYYDYLGLFDRRRVSAELGARAAQAAAKLEVIRKLLGRSAVRILDFGSGPGYFAAHAKASGAEVLCAELNDDARAYGSANFGLTYCDLADVDPGSREVATAFHVIEHLEEPVEFLRRLGATLEPGGAIVIHVPQACTTSDRLRYASKRFLGGAPQRRGSLYMPDHVVGYTAAGLRSLLERAGFTEAEVSPISRFDAEFDPTLWRLNWRSPRFVALQLQDLAMAAINRLGASRGEWLRATARK